MLISSSAAIVANGQQEMSRICGTDSIVKRVRETRHGVHQRAIALEEFFRPRRGSGPYGCSSLKYFFRHPKRNASQFARPGLALEIAASAPMAAAASVTDAGLKSPDLVRKLLYAVLISAVPASSAALLLSFRAFAAHIMSTSRSFFGRATNSSVLLRMHLGSTLIFPKELDKAAPQRGRELDKWPAWEEHCRLPAPSFPVAIGPPIEIS